MNKILTLAIPTNGVVEWVLPVLDSIYQQNIDDEYFEIVITDNGNNKVFFDEIQKYKKKHNNIVYKKTTAQLFMNQIEAFKLATGKYIKFINHRSILLPGTLNYLIDFVKNNLDEKPITYFLNDAYTPDFQKEKDKYSVFDTFAYQISYFSSWSGGVGCWKCDLPEILKAFSDNNKQTLFPHLPFVYIVDEKRNYHVDNRKLFEEIKVDINKKGNYDLFYAFAVEYMQIVKNLLDDRVITLNTYKHIKKENGEFLAKLYIDYCILKKKYSYYFRTGLIT